MKKDNYVLILKETLEIIKLNKDHTLTANEMSIISNNSKLIEKFILQKAFSIQLEIWTGKWEDKTQLWLEVVQKLFEISKEIWDTNDVFNDYLEEENKKKEEENMENK